MNLREAQELILGLVIEYDCTDWTIKFSKRMTRTLGVCSPADNTLTFSVPLILSNDWDEVNDTARHEIAHAIIVRKYPLGVERIKGGKRVYVNSGHGPEWQAMAVAVGARPHATTSTSVPAPARYHGSCPCGIEFKRHKRPRPGYVCRAKHHDIKWIDTKDWSVLYPVSWLAA